MVNYHEGSICINISNKALVCIPGNNFIFNSDHNPLAYLRKQKDPRDKFGRWILELDEYDYTVKHVPGIGNVKADALSRSKSVSVTHPCSIFDEKIYAIYNQNFMSQIKQGQSVDPVINKAMQCISNNEPIKQGRLKRVQTQLRIENDILTKSGRPVVPATLRRVHNEAYFGVEKTYALLKDRVFWPNMYKYVQIVVGSCKISQRVKCDTQPAKAPLLPMFIPNAPMQFISMDIAYMPIYNEGYQYVLVIGDIVSKFIQAIPM